MHAIEIIEVHRNVALQEVMGRVIQSLPSSQVSQQPDLTSGELQGNACSKNAHVAIYQVISCHVPRDSKLHENMQVPVHTTVRQIGLE